MGKVIKKLNKNIKLNITAVYTSKQTKEIFKKLIKITNVIISIFAGRTADIGKDQFLNLKRVLKLAKKYKKMSKYCGQAQESLIIIIKLNN